MLNGNEVALGKLLSHYHNYLMVVGLRYLSDNQRAEDVIHDVFVDLWNKKEVGDIKISVKAYLRGAVINKCLAIIRKDNRINLVESHDENLQDGLPSSDQILYRDNLKAIIDNIVEGLPEKCKRVFKMSRYEGKSHNEISKALDISKKTIENHMTKALKTLRSELKRKELLIIIFILIKLNFI